MKVEQAKQIASNAIEQLRQALETGHSERLKEYLAAMARFRRYSWGNVVLIASQKPNATHVAGFHAWHKLGRFVKKGEKGILILAPIIRKKVENNDETEPDESSSAVGFRAAYVFDVTQTDGQPLPEIGSVNGDPREYRDRLAKFVADQGIAFEYSEEIAPARGTSSGGKITLLPGQSPAEEFATLAHEVAHEMMHRDERRSQHVETHPRDRSRGRRVCRMQRNRPRNGKRSAGLHRLVRRRREAPQRQSRIRPANSNANSQRNRRG